MAGDILQCLFQPAKVGRPWLQTCEEMFLLLYLLHLPGFYIVMWKYESIVLWKFHCYACSSCHVSSLHCHVIVWKYGNMKVWKFNSAFLHSDSVIKILSSFLLLLLHGFKLCFPISEFLLRLLYWSKAHQQERRQHSGDFWQLFYLTINKIIHFVWQKRTFFILTQYKHFQVRVECRRCGELHKAYCQSLAWAANFCQLYLLKGKPVANF